MKRCIICGHIGDDSSTTCEICGTPYVDIVENGSAGVVEASTEQPAQGEPEEMQAPQAPQETLEIQDSEETDEPKEAVEPQAAGEPQVVGEPQAAGEPQETEKAQPAMQPRRMRSGPQIYGQAAANPEIYGQQGMIRRNVQGRPTGTVQRAAGRPANVRRGSQQERPVNPGQANAQGRPMNPAQGNVQGRSVNPAVRGAQGRPMNPAQGGMQGRPMNPVQGGMQGRPMNPVQGGMQGRPMSPAQGGTSRQMVQTARAALKSPVFVLIALLNTVYFVGSIAAIFMKQLNYSQVVRLLQNIKLPAQAAGYMDSVLALLGSLDTGHIALNIVLNIPNLLFCIGLWLVLITALSAKDRMSGVGFGFMKAVVIINMVKACVVMLAVLIITVAIVIAAWVSGTQSMIIASAISLVAVIVVVMMVIMYYFCYLATLKTCRRNADEGESYGTASGYVAVIHVILGLLAVVSLLSGIVNAEIAGIVSAAGKMGWMILFGVWIFMYKGRMSEYEE